MPRVPEHIRARVTALVVGSKGKKRKKEQSLQNAPPVKMTGRSVKRHSFEYVHTTVLERLIATIPEPQLRVAVRIDVTNRVDARKTTPSDAEIEKLFCNALRRLWIKLHNFQHGRTSRLGLRAQ